MTVLRLVCYLLAFAAFVAATFGWAAKVNTLGAGAAFAVFPSLASAFLSVD